MANKRQKLDLDNLTPEQEKSLEVFRKIWIEKSMDSKTNEGLAEENILKFYKMLDMKQPEFLWVDSPIQAMVAIDLLRKEDVDRKDWEVKFAEHWDKYQKDLLKDVMFIYTYVSGNQDSYWIQFYYFAKEWGYEFENDDPDVVKIWSNIADACSWWYPFEEVCICTRKPLQFHLDDQQRIHNENGPAIEHADGVKLYALHGVVVSDWLIETPKDQLDPKKILAIENAEERMVSIRYIGVENLLGELNYKVLDKEGEYELLLIDIFGNKCEYLRMINPTTDEVHIEGIKPGIKTVKDAMAWRLNLESYAEPVFKS